MAENKKKQLIEFLLLHKQRNLEIGVGPARMSTLARAVKFTRRCIVKTFLGV